MQRFGDSIDTNTRLLEDIMSDMPPHARSRSRDAGKAVTRLVNELAHKNRGCAGTALGTAYAIMYHAKRLAESLNASADRSAAQAELDASVIELPN